MQLQALTGGKIFTGDVFLDKHAVLVSRGQIQAVIPQNKVPQNVNVFNLCDNLLAPGFIDTQVNGGGGYLFNDDPSVYTIAKIANAHRQFGTTALLPTLITDSNDRIEKAIEATARAIEQRVPGVIGLHLEGPYLNPAKKGIHDDLHMRSLSDEDLETLRNTRGVGKLLITLAPECVPTTTITKLSNAGIIVACGHTAGSYDEILESLEAGVRGFTHLYNAMNPMKAREPGAVAAALLDNDSWCGLIVDGVHVHAAPLELALRTKAKGKCFLVTDASPSVGSTKTAFNFAGQEIIRSNGRVATPEGVLAGSDLDMASAVRNTVNLLNRPLEEALRMAALYPAQFLKLDHSYGKIEPGYRADFVLLNDKQQVLNTWIAGTTMEERAHAI